MPASLSPQPRFYNGSLDCISNTFRNQTAKSLAIHSPSSRGDAAWVKVSVCAQPVEDAEGWTRVCAQQVGDAEGWTRPTANGILDSWTFIFDLLNYPYRSNNVDSNLTSSSGVYSYATLAFPISPGEFFMFKQDRYKLNDCTFLGKAYASFAKKPNSLGGWSLQAHRSLMSSWDKVTCPAEGLIREGPGTAFAPPTFLSSDQACPGLGLLFFTGLSHATVKF